MLDRYHERMKETLAPVLARIAFTKPIGVVTGILGTKFDGVTSVGDVSIHWPHVHWYDGKPRLQPPLGVPLARDEFVWHIPHSVNTSTLCV